MDPIGAAPPIPLNTPKWKRVALWSTLSFLAASPDGRALTGDVCGRLQTMGIIEGADAKFTEFFEWVVRDHQLIELIDARPAGMMALTSKGRDLVLQLGAYSFSQ